MDHAVSDVEHLHAGVALVCRQQAAQSSERCSACVESKPLRPGAGKPARHGTAGVPASLAQHPFTLRFKDPELERLFTGWHATSQRLVRTCSATLRSSLILPPPSLALPCSASAHQMCVLPGNLPPKHICLISLPLRCHNLRCARHLSLFQSLTLSLAAQTDMLSPAFFLVAVVIVGFRPPYNQLVRLLVKDAACSRSFV